MNGCVPPGLTAGAGEFAEPVGARRVQEPGVTAWQVTLYLGGVKPDSALAFGYTLKPKYPVQAKATAAAYEHFTLASRAAARPVQPVVGEKESQPGDGGGTRHGPAGTAWSGRPVPLTR